MRRDAPPSAPKRTPAPTATRFLIPGSPNPLGVTPTMNILTPAHADLLDESTLRTPDEEECGALGPLGLCCTRPEEHNGPHIAHVEDCPVAMWVPVNRAYALREA